MHLSRNPFRLVHLFWADSFFKSLALIIRNDHKLVLFNYNVSVHPKNDFFAILHGFYNIAVFSNNSAYLYPHHQ